MRRSRGGGAWLMREGATLDDASLNPGLFEVPSFLTRPHLPTYVLCGLQSKNWQANTLNNPHLRSNGLIDFIFRR